MRRFYTARSGGLPVVARNHELRQCREVAAASAQRIQRREGSIAMPACQLPRPIEAEYARVRGLAACGIRACGLPQRVGGTGHVEHIVVDLERQAQFGTIDLQCLVSRPVADARGDRTQQHAGADQCAGLAPVHALDARGIEWPAHCLDVDGLSAGHARGADCLRQHLHLLQPCDLRQRAFGIASKHLECQGLQCIAGKHRSPFVEGTMAGGPTAAQVVIIHCRQVVVDQAVGVDELHGDRSIIERLRWRAERGAGGIHQHRPQSLAAAKRAVTHGFKQPRRTGVGQFQVAGQLFLGAGAPLRRARVQGLLVSHRCPRRDRRARCRHP
jgi:hypothetical protein